MEATVLYANGATKVVELDGHQTVVGKLKYAGQIERDNLMEKFYITEEGDSPLNRARWNFFCLSVQTLADPPCGLAHSSDSPDEYERKFAALMELDNETVQRWIVAINEMNTPLVSRAQLPAALLTDDEKKTSSSKRNVKR